MEIDWQKEFEDLVRYIGTITYGKERWFYQENDVWYDRKGGKYYSTNILHQAIWDAIREEIEEC